MNVYKTKWFTKFARQQRIPDSDLIEAIEAHDSPGSEANQVIKQYNKLSPTNAQDLLNFLRSL